MNKFGGNEQWEKVALTREQFELLQDLKATLGLNNEEEALRHVIETCIRIEQQHPGATMQHWRWRHPAPKNFKERIRS
ncbi:hypothetical protein JY651_31630 [Pyxidicoccus parkwayensis]|uniref:Uncharacterized protein n=1 Tax=Pyxidicoccus parkwayensis TaxID=2813578 RepID=A0ABX7NN10_9BACT|nr:hypothetical protein [Pyxidicoccus parkwaysis]QSQ19821.1 hypothetical protein JY651_31630 [Pyxidicoccus parkwaysis]